MKPMDEEHFAILRRHMVEVVAIHAELAAEDLGTDGGELPLDRVRGMQLGPVLAIGFDKTISQPFIGALMADLLAPGPREAVLEVGTGLGYQAAVLAELAARVWSVEIVEEFAVDAEANLHRFGHAGVGVRVGDGSRGWAEHAPYDKILVTAAAERPPPALLEQLKPGGRLVMPLGPAEAQRLTVIDKDAAGRTRTRAVLPVRFGRLETVL